MVSIHLHVPVTRSALLPSFSVMPPDVGLKRYLLVLAVTSVAGATIANLAITLDFGLYGLGIELRRCSGR